jgi:hypothetical protein
VSAHAPLGTGDNESIDKATVIPDPTKSWALFSSLNSDGDAQYYTFNIKSGQKLHVSIYKSMRPEDASFTPRLVIIGPDVASQGDAPPKITVPSGLNVHLVTPTEPKPTYEPFSPSTFIGLADETLHNPTPGRYYLVVYEQSDAPSGGNYGLAIGERETYTIDEWILLPFNLLNIYQWDGQSIVSVLAPMIASLIMGSVYVIWRFRKESNRNLTAWLGAIAGTSFVGTSATTLYQMLLGAAHVTLGADSVITLVFIIMQLALGLLTIRLSLRLDKKLSVKRRVYYVILGVAALFIWVGILIGPIMAIVAGVVPSTLKK